MDTEPSDAIKLTKKQLITSRLRANKTNDNRTLSFVNGTIKSDQIELFTIEGEGGGANLTIPRNEAGPPAQVLCTTSDVPSTSTAENLQPEILSTDGNKQPVTSANGRKTNLDARWNFQKGNPGKPVGSKAKLGEDFIKALANDFHAHGVGVIEKVRENSPVAYMKIIANLLPKDINLKLNSNEDLTDEQLFERIRLVRDAIEPILSAQRTIDVVAGGTEEAEDAEAVVLQSVSETEELP